MSFTRTRCSTLHLLGRICASQIVKIRRTYLPYLTQSVSSVLMLYLRDASSKVHPRMLGFALLNSTYFFQNLNNFNAIYKILLIFCYTIYYLQGTPLKRSHLQVNGMFLFFVYLLHIVYLE